MTSVRLFIVVLSISLLYTLVTGCASSQQKASIPEEYANIVEVNPPMEQNAVESTLYVDSAKVIERDGHHFLLIMGNFPDGCTHIRQAQHDVENGNIVLTLKAWRNPDRMCTQALVSFSFIYRHLPDSTLRQNRSITINDTEYPITK